MRLISAILVFAFITFPQNHALAEEETVAKIEKIPDQKDPEFTKKLNRMLERTEKSIKIIREQITQNQSAPFLADLYLQLGDSLSQKSNVLYYIQMERDKNTDLKVKATKKFSPVVMAQEEAIGIYKIVLKDFPKFDKRDKLLYRLALGLKSIDEVEEFLRVSDKMIKEYPATKETMNVRLLVGQHYYDEQDYDRSLGHLLPVMSSSFNYERNVARYRIGLIRINQEKYVDALKLFEQVATDVELKEGENPAEISLKTKAVQSNIKREALIDSVRAYTEVYKNNPEPVKYYSSIAPTEILFQEVIEKLSFRYIFLKKYNVAIKLLRTLSERTADPQKIMNIYQEVLVMIPLEDRLDVPVEEVQFVLEKFNDWTSFYEVPPKTLTEASFFFEKQVRELGTRSHDLAKREVNEQKKRELYERARQFYHLYLGFFGKGPEMVKIAINLGDVYYWQRKYLSSGTYYLRTFQGDFGTPTQKSELIQNAILSLQKKTEYSFYEQLRAKGLLVKAINSYMSFDKKKKNDPQLKFTLAKTLYEQGLYNSALKDLYAFMKQHPKSSNVEPAADLVLDYFNIRSDFKGLVDWSQKILALKIPNTAFVKRIEQVKSKALLKRLDESVKSQKGYDAFSQGKSYLETALSVKDENLRSAALEQALARSKAEKDIETFIRAAQIMAKKEKDNEKKAQIIFSIADETLAITRYAQTLSIWREVYKTPQYSQKIRSSAFEKSVKLILMMKDFVRLNAMMKDPLWRFLSDDLRRGARAQIVELLDSPVQTPSAFIESINPAQASDEEQLSLFKAQYKFPQAKREQLLRVFNEKCMKANASVCKWMRVISSHNAIAGFISSAQSTKPGLENVESMAQQMSGVLQLFKAMEGSGDATLDVWISLRQSSVYLGFGQWLKKVALAHPEAASVLNQKANETLSAGQSLKSQCSKILQSASLLSPINSFCKKGQAPTLPQALAWKKPLPFQKSQSDIKSEQITEIQKKIFIDRKNPQPYLDLAELYLNSQQYSYAAATSVYGFSTFSGQKEEFSTILGCSVGKLGLLSEATFHFKSSGDYNGLKQKCLNELQTQGGEL